LSYIQWDIFYVDHLDFVSEGYKRRAMHT